MKKFKCTEPGCDKAYNDAAHLGIHKRAAHGILGSSGNAKRRRELRAERAAAALPKPVPVVESAEAVTMTKPKRKYAKRGSLQLAKHKKDEIASNGAGEDRSNQEGHFAPDRIPEAALALALGRFQELCRSIAYELDLPPRLFTERVATFVYSAQVRQSPGRPVRVPAML